MKKKLLDALKLKFPDVSETTLSVIATNKAGSITDEAQIASVVEGITLEQVTQSVIDARIAESNKKSNQKILDALKDSGFEYKDGKLVKITADPPTPPKPGDDEPPAWAKAMMKQNEELAARVAGFEAKTKQQSLSEKLAAKLNEKKIPVSLMKKYVLNEESEIDTAFSEIEETFNEVTQNRVNSTDTAIPGGGEVKMASKKQIESTVDSWVAGKQTSTEPKK